LRDKKMGITLKHVEKYLYHIKFSPQNIALCIT
jgi:hypothetical protein